MSQRVTFKPNVSQKAIWPLALDQPVTTTKLHTHNLRHILTPDVGTNILLPEKKNKSIVG